MSPNCHSNRPRIQPDSAVFASQRVCSRGAPSTRRETALPDGGACIAQVRALASAGQTVLLSAYTHSALDNVLLKLDEMGVPLLRLGEQLSRIHPRLHKHTVEARAAAERGSRELQPREAAEIRLHRRGRQELPLRVSYLGGLTAASLRHLCGRRSSSRRMSRSSCRRCCATAGWLRPRASLSRTRCCSSASSTRAPEPGGAGGRRARADADSAPAPRVGLHRRRGGADHGARLPRPDEARRAVRARRRPLPAAAARDGADGRRARHGDLPLLAAVPGAPRRRLPAPDAVPDGGRHHGHLVAARLLGRACLRLSGEGCPGHVHDMSGTCP